MRQTRPKRYLLPTLRCLRRALSLAALPAILGGATCGPDPGPSPCELDRLGCEDPEPEDDFYLPTCPSDVGGDLTVAVGTGEASFEAFAEGQGPLVHYGPQGGQHVFMGFRVANARLDVSPKLKLQFYLGQGEGCVPPTGGETVPACAVTLGQRSLTLGGPSFALHAGTDGAIEEFGLVVFVGIPSSELPGIVALTVEDQCHRRGTSVQAWTRY